MVNQKNTQTFSPPWVGEVRNLAGAECTINSKVYHSSSVGGKRPSKTPGFPTLANR